MFEDLPKRKKITDFFADGDPVHGSTAKTEHMGKEESRKQKYRVVTYLNKEQYDKYLCHIVTKKGFPQPRLSGWPCAG